MKPLAPLTLLIAILAAGCQRTSTSTTPPAKACVKEGDRCEYAEGKIGLCTAKPEACATPPCLVCMSLH
jgi:hypothetical protein